MCFTRGALRTALLVKCVTICNTSGISVIEIYRIRTSDTFDGLIKLLCFADQAAQVPLLFIDVFQPVSNNIQ